VINSGFLFAFLWEENKIPCAVYKSWIWDFWRRVHGILLFPSCGLWDLIPAEGHLEGPRLFFFNLREFFLGFYSFVWPNKTVWVYFCCFDDEEALGFRFEEGLSALYEVSLMDIQHTIWLIFLFICYDICRIVIKGILVLLHGLCLRVYSDVVLAWLAWWEKGKRWELYPMIYIGAWFLILSAWVICQNSFKYSFCFSMVDERHSWL